MSNKFIYPILIIIFSILIIFGILNRRNNQRLNNNIEKFTSSPPVLDGMSQDLGFNIQNNTDITITFANGNWTTINTIFNIFPVYECPNIDYYELCCCYHTGYCESPTAYWCTNYMTINITGTTGTIFNPNGLLDTYNITYILNETITGVLSTNSNYNIQIKFLNFFNGETYGNLTNASDTYTSVITIFNGDAIVVKYLSFKLLFNNCANCYYYEGDYCIGNNGNIPNINNNTYYNFITQPTYALLPQTYQPNGGINPNNNIDTGNNYIINPSQIYDINAYNIIISPNYQYRNNFITLNFGEIPSSETLNNIQTNYGGKINFSIQRQFLSPTGQTIQSVMSNLLSLSVLQKGKIPKNIVISSFQSDMEANNLNSFFQPLSTKLYIQLLSSSNPSYSFSNNNMKNVPSSTFNLQNNANNMYQQNIQFPDLNSLTQTNTNTYNITLIGTYSAPNDITQETDVSFGDLGL